MTNKVRWVEVHLHGHCEVADEEVKPFGIGCIGPSEGEMRECDAGAKKKCARPDGIDFQIEGDQNVPEEKGESSDWGYWSIKERRRK
jgi:hypothetical protein